MKKFLTYFLSLIAVCSIGYFWSDPVMGQAIRIFTVQQGGTGTGQIPNSGDVLVATQDGKYTPMATSTLGILGSSTGGFSTSSADYWGSTKGYLTEETDPTYTSSSWYTTTNNSSNWDTAYGWGDHALAGYYPAANYNTDWATQYAGAAAKNPFNQTLNTGDSPQFAGLTVTGTITVQNVTSTRVTTFGNSTSTGYISAGDSIAGFNYANGDINGNGRLFIGGVATTTGNTSLQGTLYVKDGSVGIGTATPSAKLHIFESSAQGVLFRVLGPDVDNVDIAEIALGKSGPATDYATLGVQEATGGLAKMFYLDMQSAAKAFVVLNSGSVGMSTSTPGGYYGEKLTVLGGANIIRSTGGNEILFNVGTTTSANIFVVKSNGRTSYGSATAGNAQVSNTFNGSVTNAFYMKNTNTGGREYYLGPQAGTMAASAFGVYDVTANAIRWTIDSAGDNRVPLLMATTTKIGTLTVFDSETIRRASGGTETLFTVGTSTSQNLFTLKSNGGILFQRQNNGGEGPILTLSNNSNTEVVGTYTGIRFGDTNNDETQYKKGGIFYSLIGEGYGHGDMIFAQDSVNSTSNADIGDAVMTIKNSGKIGIATTTPGGYYGEKLTIVDSVNIMRDSGGQEALFNVGTTTANILSVKSNGFVGLGTASPTAAINVVSAAGVAGTGAGVNGTDGKALMVFTGGDGGIGWTGNALNVPGTAGGSTPTSSVAFGNAGAGGPGWSGGGLGNSAGGDGGTARGLSLIMGNGGRGGNVGAGSGANPGGRGGNGAGIDINLGAGGDAGSSNGTALSGGDAGNLSINGKAGGTSLFGPGGDGTRISISAGPGGDGGGIGNGGDGGPITLTAGAPGTGSANGTAGYIALMGGNVGVNTASPAAQLHVNGDARITTLNATSTNIGSLRVYGNATTTLNTTLVGTYGNTTFSAPNVYIDANGLLYRASSARKYKDNINYSSVNPDWVYKMKPVTFNEKSTKDSYIGFIADDLSTIDKRFATYGNNKEVEGIQINAIVSALVSTVQEQKKEIDSLKTGGLPQVGFAERIKWIITGKL